MARDDQPTWVYRLYCEHEMTLYVGIASDLDRRLAQHRATKPWWPEVAIIEARLLPSRAEARALEATNIAAGAPRYNVSGRRPAVDGVAARTPLPFPVLAGRTYRVTAGQPACTDDWSGLIDLEDEL